MQFTIGETVRVKERRANPYSLDKRYFFNAIPIIADNYYRKYPSKLTNKVKTKKDILAEFVSLLITIVMRAS